MSFGGEGVGWVGAWEGYDQGHLGGGLRGVVDEVGQGGELGCYAIIVCNIDM